MVMMKIRFNKKSATYSISEELEDSMKGIKMQVVLRDKHLTLNYFN